MNVCGFFPCLTKGRETQFSPLLCNQSIAASHLDGSSSAGLRPTLVVPLEGGKVGRGDAELSELEAFWTLNFSTFRKKLILQSRIWLC